MARGSGDVKNASYMFCIHIIPPLGTQFLQGITMKITFQEVAPPLGTQFLHKLNVTNHNIVSTKHKSNLTEMYKVRLAAIPKTIYIYIYGPVPFSVAIFFRRKGT